MYPNEFLNWHFRDNKFAELRHQTPVGWISFWYDNQEDLIHKANELSPVGNLFLNLNRPFEITNKPVTNDDIKLHTRLLFDFDPVRPKSTSSTVEELEDARELAIKLIKHLTALGWPAPLKAISGNGAHVQYRAPLPNNAETKAILKSIYTGLQKEFTTESVEFDPTVRNAGRISTLYGSIKRKGISTKERPHRPSIASIPSDWKQVSPKLVESLANYYEKRSSSHYKPKVTLPQRQVGKRSTNVTKGDYTTLDVVAMFNAHGLYLQQVETEKHYVTCPWIGEHSSTGPKDTVIWEASGNQWPTFHCSHSHCDGRNIADVLQLFSDADSFCSQEYQGVNHGS